MSGTEGIPVVHGREEVNGPQTPWEAMRVLLLFLLAAGDGPITSFNETAIEWARMHHKPSQ